MPIRLLSFDSTGVGIELVERSEVLLLVQQKMYVASNDPEFVDNWTKAGQMMSSDDIESWRLGYIKKKELVNRLVARYAQYAILSHTWIRDTPGDVVYKDWDTREDNFRGYAKIEKFCEVAATNHGVRLAWMDTVCINKDSSSELDESIRSMYKWYRGAGVCLTYLAESRILSDVHTDSWFTRGWTLQELLAPQKIHFYNMDWVEISSYEYSERVSDSGHPTDSFQRHKATEIIRNEIQEATSITEDEFILCRSGKIEKLPISRIFQLATYRGVTREEDKVYSLMGLLGVDISVAYGEGSERAFFRLVRELLTAKKHVLDIFNHIYWKWTDNTLIPTSIDQYTQRSIVFEGLGDGTSLLLDQWQPLEPIVMTHLGVRIPLLLFPALMSFDFSETYSHYAPFGDISGIVELYVLSKPDVINKKRFYLLDRRLFEDNTHGLLSSDFDNMDIVQRSTTSEVFNVGTADAAPDKQLEHRTFGVFNFSVDDNDILLPQQCMSVLLDCGKIKPGEVRPSDTVKIMGTELAPVFELASTVYKKSIPLNKLSRHGMQVVTLYL